MIIIEDTRNKIGKHERLNNDLRKSGHTVIRNKLIAGDYARADSQKVLIDTKQDWVEVAGNICGSQHARFRRECELAQQCRLQLIILVEEDCEPEEWIVPRRKSGKPITQVKPQIMAKAIKTMKQKYGVDFIHCDKKQTANKIIELLKGEKEDEII